METKIQIKSIYGSILFGYKKENNCVKDTLLEAIERGANLRGAYLSSANLSSANLRDAGLSDADLRGADLSGANLRGADLRGAYLRGADLRGAYLSSANLSSADLSDANLRDANLRGAYLSSANLSSANLRDAGLSDAGLSDADLRGANLRSADLRGANLRGADLRGADLSGADLSSANLSSADLSSADLSDVIANENTCMYYPQCPMKGSFIGYKKAGEKIVKILITEDAKRSSATTLKCRCSRAKVLEIQEKDGSTSELKEIRSDKTSDFIYKVGEVVEVLDFDEDRWNECSTGIQFFISREMAVIYRN